MDSFKLDVKNSLSELLNYNYHIETIDYDKQNFGNICIVIKKDIEIKFISDKDEFFCVICYENDTYPIEDIFKFLGCKWRTVSSEFLDFLTSCSLEIFEHIKNIEEMFSHKNISINKIRLKEIAQKRILDLFDN